MYLLLEKKKREYIIAYTIPTAQRRLTLYRRYKGTEHHVTQVRDGALHVFKYPFFIRRQKYIFYVKNIYIYICYAYGDEYNAARAANCNRPQVRDRHGRREVSPPSRSASAT